MRAKLKTAFISSAEFRIRLLDTQPIAFGTAIADTIPMIATAITSSSSVKPLWFFIVVLTPKLLGSLGRGFSWSMLREALSFGLPKVPHGLAYQALNLADRKLLDVFASRAEAGLYHVAYMFGTGVKFFLSAFELAWAPFVYSLLKRADAPATLARIVTYASAILISVGLGVAVLAREILMLMTDPTPSSLSAGCLSCT